MWRSVLRRNVGDKDGKAARKSNRMIAPSGPVRDVCIAVVSSEIRFPSSERPGRKPCWLRETQCCSKDSQRRRAAFAIRRVLAATYDHLYGIAAFKKLARKLWCRCGVVVVSVGPLWGCRWVLWGLCGAFVGRQIFLCIKFEMTFFSKKCDPKFPGR